MYIITIDRIDDENTWTYLIRSYCVLFWSCQFDSWRSFIFQVTWTGVGNWTSTKCISFWSSCTMIWILCQKTSLSWDPITSINMVGLSIVSNNVFWCVQSMMGLLGFEMLMIRLWNTDQPDPEKAGCWEKEVSVGPEVSMCNGKSTIFLEVSSPNLHHQNMDPQNCHAWRWKFLGQTKIAGYTYFNILYIYIHGMYGLNLELCFLVQHGCWKSSTEKQVGLTKDLPRPNRDTVESLMKRFDTSGKKTLNVKDFFECLRLQLLDVGWWVKRFVYHRSLWEGRDDFNLFFHPKSWRRFRRWNPFNLSILCWRVETTNQLSFSTRVRCACVLRSTQLHLSDNRCFPTKFVSSEHLV